ncbi:fused (3R)-hydroxyacyl-ACP dehydratase subunits HadA/HadB [Nocardia sp. NBC_01388]|uniref:fused (3R)-hydroxyacyl-ACP dehydratase subunits HadA/HadB n=1 Tax=Nocardia sp. NBC_01388 TaxID=2903596 RepID=UPI0032523339
MHTLTSADPERSGTAVAFDPVAHAQSIAGRRYRLGTDYEVGSEKIREYARAVQDSHSVHRDTVVAVQYGYAGLLAPPTFGSLLADSVQEALSELLIGFDLTAMMQTDQIFDFLRPVVAGDRLTSHISLRSFRQAFGGTLFVVENAVTNQRGEVALTAQTSLIARSNPTGSHSDAARSLARIMRRKGNPVGPVTPVALTVETESAVPRSLRARSVSSVSVGELLPSSVLELSLGDLVHYAGVSGDANPIHWHSPTAELFGLDGTVAHGMLTMGLGAGYVTSWLDDPGALRQYCVRMTSPVHVNADRPSAIEYQGKVKSLDPDTGLTTIVLTAMHNGRKIFGRATATVQLSDRAK